MVSQGWVIHKFGGTSVLNAERYLGVSKIIATMGAGERRGIVVSAMKGVTDDLLESVELARKRDESYKAKLEKIKARHLEAIAGMLKKSAEPLKAVIEKDFAELAEVLRGTWHVQSASDRTTELVSGFGEVWSAQLLHALLSEQGVKSAWLNARDVLVVEPDSHAVTVDWKESQKRIDAWKAKAAADVVVITGFVASTPDGGPTTLKRNGSDFSASIFGALLEASEIFIWTDVDGVLSADPRLVPEAVVLDELSYREVTELAYFGAKVVHPSTMEPAIRKKIPVWIRNTFKPELRGTRIHAAAKSDRPVKGFASIEGMALVNLEGTGMSGVPGIAEKLFGALRSAGVSVTMISQASSEHSICFAIPEAQSERAKRAVDEAFYGEISQGRVQPAEVAGGCSILAVVGDNMVEHPGISGRFFGALGTAGINVRAIAQGSSERNISAVIGTHESERALRAAHSAFYLSNLTLSVGVFGSGLIGAEFLRQLATQAEYLKRERKIDVQVRGIANSRKMLLSERGIPLEDWKARLEKDGKAADPAAFVRHLKPSHVPHSVLIDATANADLPLQYPSWLESGIHVITPNKKGNAGTLQHYRAIRKSSSVSQRHFLYSTNVGAGLPILATLRSLHQTGDRVLSVEGILSGTLSYLFNQFSGEVPFSKIVEDAKARGYTEPDPRDDLSGMDVARKLVILGREIGLPLELDQVEVENLVPEALRSLDVPAFMKRLGELDPAMTKLLEQARKGGQALRYVGSISEKGEARVKLGSYPQGHPFAGLSGSDNIVLFRTQRYDRQPLVIRGPGAGPEVTAGGVFADLLRLASFLGAAP
jgi:bifunctional aspartokinase / homoserine dehydrogenase 1